MEEVVTNGQFYSSGNLPEELKEEFKNYPVVGSHKGADIWDLANSEFNKTQESEKGAIPKYTIVLKGTNRIFSFDSKERAIKVIEEW